MRLAILDFSLMSKGKMAEETHGIAESWGFFYGFSMDFLWIVYGCCMDFVWVDVFLILCLPTNVRGVPMFVPLKRRTKLSQAENWNLNLAD